MWLYDVNEQQCVRAVGPAQWSYYWAADRSLSWKHCVGVSVWRQQCQKKLSQLHIFEVSTLLGKHSRLWMWELWRAAISHWPVASEPLQRFCTAGRAADMRILLFLYLTGWRHGTIFNKKEWRWRQRCQLRITQWKKRRKGNRKLMPTSRNIRLRRATVMEKMTYRQRDVIICVSLQDHRWTHVVASSSGFCISILF